ncbi:MAG: hypothetical protein WHT06_03765 [Desulfobacterales bacterium]
MLGRILGTIAEVGYVQAILGGMTYAVPKLRLFENPLSWMLIVLVAVSAAWPLLSMVIRNVNTDLGAGVFDRLVSATFRRLLDPEMPHLSRVSPRP